MLTINLCYLNLSRSLTLRPRRIVLDGAANAARKASFEAVTLTTRF